MKMASLLATLCLLAINTVQAAPIKFQCTASDGGRVADLIVDIEKRSLTWASGSKYTIHSINNQYISAYENIYSGEVGGEVWVLNRITGEYLRAATFIGWYSPEAAKSEPGKLTGNIYRGKYSKPLF